MTSSGRRRGWARTAGTSNYRSRPVIASDIVTGIVRVGSIDAETPPRRAAPPLWAMLVAESGGRPTHYVTEEQVCAPLRGLDPQAICGRRFVPAALTTPLGPLCETCRDRIHPPGPLPRVGRRRRVAGRTGTCCDQPAT